MSDSGKQIGDCQHSHDPSTCVACLQSQVASLQAFKTWVHEYLDAHGVPHHPPGTHGAAGCRIGDRMDWLMAQLPPARPSLLEQLNSETPGFIGATEKPRLSGLVRDNPATPEGKYHVRRRDGTTVEWPSFVLGARDPHAAVALRAYAASIATDPDCHPDFPARLLRLADEFDAYRAEHGPGDPTRGLHRKDDPATVAEMRKGRSA